MWKTSHFNWPYLWSHTTLTANTDCGYVLVPTTSVPSFREIWSGSSFFMLNIYGMTQCMVTWIATVVCQWCFWIRKGASELDFMLTDKRMLRPIYIMCHVWCTHFCWLCGRGCGVYAVDCGKCAWFNKNRAQPPLDIPLLYSYIVHW